ncbi:DUF3048 domain-containing protein [Peribacillus deserti]|uniref:DUF3048 domain-containing protein n=1 Tax=Peribacillus deserti TaxID=673318 RepID=A0A2N5M2L6_9BACI|nr:DUF3048 domain-containing protein [Peribacillus deserti]PLT28614.1 DUF3048 domain-containing protein [Peribacillus deserti]
MKVKLLGITLASLLIVTGCSGHDKSGKPSEHPNEAAEQEAEPKEYSNTFPLTGIRTDEAVNQRAVAVMVNNHPKARPQSGLSKADIVYELLAEGEVTRFLAIYQSEKPKRVGPVRSARDYYIRLAKGFNSLYILHGYSPEAKELLEQGYMDHLNGLKYDGTLFKREPSRKAPHNSYISFKNILKGAKNHSYNMDTPPGPFTFLEKEQVNNLGGEAAEEADVSYHSSQFDVHYEYDSKIQKYKRYTAEELTVDEETNKPVLIDNLLVIDAPHQVTDSKGRRDIDLQAGGKGYLLQKGKANEVDWELENDIIVPLIHGSEAGFVPGKTWVNVIPDVSDLSIKP